MKTSQEIRIENIRAIIEDKFNGRQKDFAEHLGLNRNTVSRWMGSNAVKSNVSDSTARNIEAAIGLEIGYLDHSHSETVRDINKDLTEMRRHFKEFAAMATASETPVDPVIIFDAAHATLEAKYHGKEANPLQFFLKAHTSD